MELLRIMGKLRVPANEAQHFNAVCELEKFYKHPFFRPKVEEVLKGVIKNESIHISARDKAKQILKIK